MSRPARRPTRRPPVSRDTQTRATQVFREFVRQLEKLDLRPRKMAREASR